jgi:hypothetical protein
VNFVRPPGVVGQRIDGGGKVLSQHGRNRLAGVAAFQLGQFIAMLFDQFGEPEQDVTSLGGAHGAPGAFEGAAGGCDSALDIGLVAFRDGCDDLPGCRIERVEGAP